MAQISDKMTVEVVFATRDRQELVPLRIPAGSTVEDAIGLSGLDKIFPDFDLERMQAGIWGRPVELRQKLREGDRVEIYRPLLFDPRIARRDLAAEGKLMGQDTVLPEEGPPVRDPGAAPDPQQSQTPGRSRKR